MHLTFPEYSAIILCYLIGSVTFGSLVARVAGLGDLRRQGSGNIGATNVARIGGKKLGAITLLLDALKGLIPILFIRWHFSYDISLFSSLAVVLGHIFPVFAKFKGGKGVATGFGVMLALNWLVGVYGLVLWLLIFWRTKISSLAAIIAFTMVPFFAFFVADPGFVALCFILSFIIIARHRANIVRIFKGEEGKLAK